MKGSVVSSAVIHAAILGWGLLTFSAPAPMVADVESMPIDIVPVESITQLQQGDKKAPKAEKPAPKPAEKPQTQLDAQNIGDSDLDTKTKETLEIKPKPVESAQAPKPSEAPVPKPEPQPEPKPEVKPEPKPEPVPATEVKPEPAPKQEVKPDPVAAAITEAKPDPVPQEETFKLPENVAKPEAKPTQPAQTAKTPERKEPEKPKQTQTAAKPSKEKGIADEVAELLNNQKPSAGGAKRSTDRASLGADKATGGSKLSQSEMDALRSAIEGNWNKPVGAEEYPDMKIIVSFKLTPSGEIEGSPVVSGSGGEPGLLNAIKSSALRAVMRSVPFNLPQDKYDTWKDVELTFYPGTT
ncbi:cell envelope integrity protein TolA [Phyllobacterium sp. BT25]|uniref:Cell envelope integrity protein TolA n=1 Tax=Phyllobacterium pellucidum TaxID=2740464 RepID=A0A849VWN1_9HYPH|nr:MULTISPECIES: cell envelope integrity protein TolA [Phyllobacterium]NTS32360.1 cell envelope integrity protein TolA [Phyllobacterium pellucidum]UGY09762.1 cell envelope integrity protein TolA [Phyllobacterium sp. T1018]